MAVSIASPTWTEARIREQGVRMDSVLALQAVYGVGRTKAYELLRAGQEFDFRVLRLGRLYVTPTSDVLRLLGLDAA